MSVDRNAPVKEWLEPMIDAWVGQSRHLLYGKGGWPLRTVLARVIDDGAGASHSAPNQRTFEVYHRDGLTIRRAMEGMPLLQRQVFVAHYLAHGNASEKAKILGLSKSRYWAILDTAYYYLAGRIDATA